MICVPQLRYYDSAEDPTCKGFIDLADVVSVAAIKNVQGAPKKSDDGAFFEVSWAVQLTVLLLFSRVSFTQYIATSGARLCLLCDHDEVLTGARLIK